MDQEEFDRYMRKLPYHELCNFTIKSIVPLCSFCERCPYQGNEIYTYKGNQHKECKREKILHYKQILGVTKNKQEKINQFLS